MDIMQLDKATAYNASQPEPKATHFALLVEAYQDARGLEVDGAYGPKTRAQLERDLDGIVAPNVQNPTPSTANPADVIVAPWPAFDGPLRLRPRNEREIVAVFGDPGEGSVPDPVWERGNLITRGPSNPLPGARTEGPGRYVTLHRLADPYAEEGLRRAKLACPEHKIHTIGGHNHRRMRHDTIAKARAAGRAPLPFSRHKWGIALDINSALNGARTFANGAPEPWSPEWLAIWPDGLPEAFVVSMESVGWRWGGRWRKFCDPMHFELCGGSEQIML